MQVIHQKGALCNEREADCRYAAAGSHSAFGKDARIGWGADRRRRILRTAASGLLRTSGLLRSTGVCLSSAMSGSGLCVGGWVLVWQGTTGSVAERLLGSTRPSRLEGRPGISWQLFPWIRFAERAISREVAA